jgi:hypothetical protein
VYFSVRFELDDRWKEENTISAGVKGYRKCKWESIRADASKSAKNADNASNQMYAEASHHCTPGLEYQKIASAQRQVQSEPALENWAV